VFPKWSIYHGANSANFGDRTIESVPTEKGQASDAGIRVDRDEFRRPLKGRIRLRPRSLSTPILTSHESRTGDLHFGMGVRF